MFNTIVIIISTVDVCIVIMSSHHDGPHHIKGTLYSWRRAVLRQRTESIVEGSISPRSAVHPSPCPGLRQRHHHHRNHSCHHHHHHHYHHQQCHQLASHPLHWSLSSPCALRALGLLLADGTLTVGGGKTF